MGWVLLIYIFNLLFGSELIVVMIIVIYRQNFIFVLQVRLRGLMMCSSSNHMKVQLMLLCFVVHALSLLFDMMNFVVIVLIATTLFTVRSSWHKRWLSGLGVGS